MVASSLPQIDRWRESWLGEEGKKVERLSECVPVWQTQRQSRGMGGKWLFNAVYMDMESTLQTRSFAGNNKDTNILDAKGHWIIVYSWMMSASMPPGQINLGFIYTWTTTEIILAMKRWRREDKTVSWGEEGSGRWGRGTVADWRTVLRRLRWRCKVNSSSAGEGTAGQASVILDLAGRSFDPQHHAYTCAQLISLQIGIHWLLWLHGNWATTGGTVWWETRKQGGGKRGGRWLLIITCNVVLSMQCDKTFFWC